MNSAGVTPLNLLKRYAFAVEIAGFSPALFHKVSAVEIEFDEVMFNPAGSLFPQKSAGRVKFPDITLEKGVLADGTDTAFITWIRQQITVGVAVGAVPADYMKDLDIVRYDDNENEVRRVRCYGCFVKTGKLPEGDGGSSDVDIESITICMNRWEQL